MRILETIDLDSNIFGNYKVVSITSEDDKTIRWGLDDRNKRYDKVMLEYMLNAFHKDNHHHKLIKRILNSIVVWERELVVWERELKFEKLDNINKQNEEI